MSPAEDVLIDELARHERAGDLASAFRVLGKEHLTPNSLGFIAISLYRRDLSALAFVITQKLLEAGIQNWTIHALAAHLAIRLDQTQAATPSIARLAQLLSEADATQRKAARDLLDPFLQRDVVMAFHTGNHALAAAYTRLWGAIDSSTLTRLAPPAPEHSTDLSEFQVADSAKLLQFEAPPAGTRRVLRRVVLGIRHRWSPEQPNSRKHDIPARYALALESYNWRVRRHDLRSLENAAIVAEDFQALAAMCRETEADLLILDDFQAKRGNGSAGDIVAALRRDRPTLRILSLYFDPWQPERWDDIEASAELLDGIWSLVVVPLWERAAFKHKTLFLPFPHGGTYPAPPPLEPRFRFGGGVQYTNWDRALWASAIVGAELPLRIEASDHQEDHRDPLESYRAYMRRSQTGEAVLNFARRSNGICTLTGRTFETLATGGLLVQERSDDIDLFFTAGRHYLSFETLSDLFDVVALLKRAPDRAEVIRQEGAAFFAARYSDERLIAYLDHFLFRREAMARGRVTTTHIGPHDHQRPPVTPSTVPVT